MTRQRLAEALLRVYPAAWRREYGEELFDILISRPLTWRVAADVLGAGLRQRIRAAEPATVLGVATVAVLLSQLALTAAGYRTPATAMLRPTDMTFPTVAASFMVSPVYPWLLIALWLVDGVPPLRLLGEALRHGHDADVAHRRDPGAGRRSAARR